MSNQKTWDATLNRIERGQAAPPNELKSAQKKRIASLLGNYAEFVKYYFSEYAKFECATFHTELAEYVVNNKVCNVNLVWFRGAAKSTHSNLFLPIYLMVKKELYFMVLCGHTELQASILLTDLHTNLAENQRLINDFGEFLPPQTPSDCFTTKAGVTFKSIGLGSKPRGMKINGHRPDYIVADDIEDDKVCENGERVAGYYRWLNRALRKTMDFQKEDTRRRFIISNNLFHDAGIIARFINNKSHKTIQVNALIKPEKEPTKPIWKYDGWIPAWEAKISNDDYYKEYLTDIEGFDAEFMNIPPISRERIFRSEWLQFKKMYYTDYKTIEIYIDPAYRKSKRSDTFAIMVWAKWHHQYHLLDVYCRKSTLSEAANWLYQFDDNLPAGILANYRIEQYFQQFNTFNEELSTRAPNAQARINLYPDIRTKGEKWGRIMGLQLIFEGRNVFISKDIENKADTQEFIKQFLEFPKGKVDSLDATEGAWHYLKQYSERTDDNFRFIEERTDMRY